MGRDGGGAAERRGGDASGGDAPKQKREAEPGPSAAAAAAAEAASSSVRSVRPARRILYKRLGVERSSVSFIRQTPEFDEGTFVWLKYAQIAPTRPGAARINRDLMTSSVFTQDK